VKNLVACAIALGFCLAPTTASASSGAALNRNASGSVAGTAESPGPEGSCGFPSFIMTFTGEVTTSAGKHHAITTTGCVDPTSSPYNYSGRFTLRIGKGTLSGSETGSATGDLATSATFDLNLTVKRATKTLRHVQGTLHLVLTSSGDLFPSFPHDPVPMEGTLTAALHR
jgi:hypothetical protein